MKVIAWPAFKTKYKNPYNWLLYTEMQQQGIDVTEFSVKQLLRQHYDIFHLHWPVETIIRHPNFIMAFIRAITMLLLIDWVRIRKTRIIWTVHDQNPHSIVHPRLANWFQHQFIRRVDGCINLCQSSQAFIEAQFPLLKKCDHCIIPHGHYRGIYPDTITHEAARTLLNLKESDRILLFLGYIDFYKNVPHLIQVFENLNSPDWILMVAGKPEHEQLKVEIIKIANQSKRIKFKLQFIPDEELQNYFKAADLVVLPFLEILNSGSALLALSFNCPILVPNQGAMAELQGIVGSDWMQLYQGELTPTVLQAGLDWAVNFTRPRPANLDQLNWSKLSQKTVAFYEAVQRKNSL